MLQEALLRALRAYPRLRHAEHLRAWLYRVTTTTAYDAHRAAPPRAPTADPPAVAVEPEHYDGAFEALIAPLPDGVRRPLRLRFVDDLDYEGIADRLAAPRWPRASASRPPSAPCEKRLAA